jgi:hypothetical protein
MKVAEILSIKLDIPLSIIERTQHLFFVLNLCFTLEFGQTSAMVPFFFLIPFQDKQEFERNKF